MGAFLYAHRSLAWMVSSDHTSKSIPTSSSDQVCPRATIFNILCCTRIWSWDWAVLWHWEDTGTSDESICIGTLYLWYKIHGWWQRIVDVLHYHWFVVPAQIVLLWLLSHVEHVHFVYISLHPVVSAHSLAFSSRQMWLCVMCMWLLERTFCNCNGSAAFGVQI